MCCLLVFTCNFAYKKLNYEWNSVKMKQLKHKKACFVQHGMTSLSFQTAMQKNEEKLSSFVQFKKEIASYCAL